MIVNDEYVNMLYYILRKIEIQLWFSGSSTRVSTKDLFLQDLLCWRGYQLSSLNISIILSQSICGVLKVMTMSICNRVMPWLDTSPLETQLGMEIRNLPNPLSAQRPFLSSL